MSVSQEAVKLRRTRSKAVYECIRDDIFAGRLAPGERLKFPAICDRYDTSVGAAREALTRLTLERLVTSQPNQGGQGYAVVELSVQELTDLTTARCEIEIAAFRLSVTHGTPEWEAGVVAAHHLLSRLAVPDAQSSDEQISKWASAHHAFHRALLSGCPSARLRDIAGGLRDEAELYRRWTIPIAAESRRDVAAEHRAMMMAALAGEADEAAALLSTHIAMTTNLLLVSPEATGSGILRAEDHRQRV